MTTDFHDWMVHPEQLNKETLYELRTILARYPYFQAIRILYLKNLYILHDPSFGEELHKAALFITDKRALFYFVEGERLTPTPHNESAETPAQTPDEDRTLRLIDDFLADLPQEEQTEQEEYPSLENDYLTYTLREEDLPQQTEEGTTTPMRGQELIDDFIEKADEGHSFRIAAPVEEEEESGKTAVQPTSNEEEDESYFTETLAKIYIKQKRYEKALEIIKKLSLKYPKKNSYFADQIRFLEKLIINSKSK